MTRTYHEHWAAASRRTPAPIRWTAIFLIAQTFWFWLVFPLVPASFAGFLIELAAGVAVLAATYGALFGTASIAPNIRKPLLRRLIATVLACSIGGGVFMIAWLFRSMLSAHFTYFALVRHF